MQNQDDIIQIENHIKELTKKVKLHEALERLEKNPEFKKVINEAYISEEGKRLIGLRGDTSIEEPIQKQVLKSIDGIGYFQSFLCPLNNSRF